MITLYEKRTVADIFAAVNKTKYFEDCLDEVMYTFRDNESGGREFYSSSPTVGEVAGPIIAAQDQEILNFYLSLRDAVQDFIENDCYLTWIQSFTPVTYRSFLTAYLEESKLRELEDSVVAGEFIFVSEFIEYLEQEYKNLPDQKVKERQTV